MLMSEALTNSQSQLDELNVTSFYWTIPELRVWVNDACRDIARRTETIEAYTTSLTAVAGQAKYNLPADVIRVHRCEFIPTNSTQVYPIQASTYDELDQIWGINPSFQSSYPSAYACWGTPGSMTILFYPVPAQTGTFNFYYYAMPVNLATAGTTIGAGADDGKTLTIPFGWDDLIVEYVTYRAMTKAKDPNWQTHKQLYDQNIQYLIDVTRQAHDNGRFIQTMTSNVPQWLYQFTDE